MWFISGLLVLLDRLWLGRDVGERPGLANPIEHGLPCGTGHCTVESGSVDRVLRAHGMAHSGIASSVSKFWLSQTTTRLLNLSALSVSITNSSR